jgi:hypothetical protein
MIAERSSVRSLTPSLKSGRMSAWKEGEYADILEVVGF